MKAADANAAGFAAAVPDGLRLNIGCGLDIAAGMVNADLAPLPGVDVVCDLDDKWPWPDGSAGYVRASHVFEHVRDPLMFMGEAWRVLAAGGLLDIRVPFFAHPNSFTDPTHLRHCTLDTFHYWIAGQGLHEAFGAGMGSPPAVFEGLHRSLNGDEEEELQVILRKIEADQ